MDEKERCTPGMCMVVREDQISIQTKLTNLQKEINRLERRLSALEKPKSRKAKND